MITVPHGFRFMKQRVVSWCRGMMLGEKQLYSLHRSIGSISFTRYSAVQYSVLYSMVYLPVSRPQARFRGHDPIPALLDLVDRPFVGLRLLTPTRFPF